MKWDERTHRYREGCSIVLIINVLSYWNDQAVNYCEIINPDMCGILLGVFLQTFTHIGTYKFTHVHNTNIYAWQS